MKSLGFTGWIDEAVGQANIHRAQAGRRHVTQVGDLDRSRFSRQEQQSISPTVAGEVDQQVDPIVADLPCRVIVRRRDDVSPDVSLAAQAIGQLIRFGDAGIAEHFDRVAVVMLEDRLDERRHREYGEA